MKAIMRDEREMICINTLEVKAIPINWTMTNLQNLFYIKAGGDAKPEYYVEKKDKEHPYPVYTNSKDAYSTYAFTSVPIFEGNTITVSGRGAIGQAFYREKPYDAIIRLLSLSPKLKIEPRYYTYWINNVTQIVSYSTVIGQLSAQQLAPYKAAVPSLYEQQLIANYLDDRCSKIDAIIAEAKTSIEEYKELKQAVIYEAVTKGLDKNVEMEDTGIKWVGLIPAHWEYKKLRYSINNIGDIDHYMPESVTNGIPYIMTGDLKSRISEIDFDKCKQVARTDYEKLSAKIKAEKGDIIFARYATIGSLCYVDIDADFLVSYSCVIIKPNPKVIESHFLEYYLQSNSFIEESKRYANANVQANVGKESMYQAKIALPPLKEQQDIVRFLDIQTCSLDSLISEKLSLIEDLESYKKSLIYEVVTGKRKVVE